MRIVRAARFSRIVGIAGLIVIVATLVIGPSTRADMNCFKAVADDVEAAITACSALVESGREPPDVVAHARINRAAAYARTKAYALAMVDLEEAVRLAPRDANAIYARGRMHERQGQNDSALADFRAAQVLDSKSDYIGKGVARLEAGAGRPDYDFVTPEQRARDLELLRKVLTIVQEKHGPNHPATVTTLGFLGKALLDADHFAEAEGFLRKALETCERINAKNNCNVSLYLSHIGQLLQATNRHAEAEPLFRRALGIYESRFGPEHDFVASALTNHAGALTSIDRSTEAEALLRRALAIRRKLYTGEHPNIAAALNRLAQLQHLKQSAEAEQGMREALGIYEKHFGKEHPKVATELNNLAVALHARKRLTDAEPLFRRALAIFTKTLGKNDSSVGVVASNLALLRAELGDWSEAAHLSKLQLAALLSARSDAVNDRVDIARLSIARQSANLRLAARAMFHGVVDTGDEAFAMAQMAVQTSAADALAQVSARFAKGAGPLADIVRQRQDLLGERRRADARLLATLGLAEPHGTQAARVALAELDTKLDAFDARLPTEYKTLTAPNPLTVKAAQDELGHDEALIVYLDIPHQPGLPEETLVWVLTKTKALWSSLPLGTADLVDRVAPLLCGLDRDRMWSWSRKEGRYVSLSEGCNVLFPEGVRDGETLPFHLGVAREAYHSLLGHAEELIKDKKLIIVPSGFLTLLPFHALVTGPSTPQGWDNPETRLETYRRTPWLALRHAITILPSVSSLKILRHMPHSKAEERYIAFGNPLLDGDKPEHKIPAKEALAKYNCEQNPSRKRQQTSVVKNSPLAIEVYKKSGLNLMALRKQAPLPETADEICTIADKLGALKRENATVWLASRATEANVKALSRSGELARYRTLHFATHGFLPSETEWVAKQPEPALLLTPPKSTSTVAQLEVDNGLLTASEIAELRLDADLVVLSACNTAGGDKADGAALSGLARAFFYAKARTLLVSHWYVDSKATERLIVETFAQLGTDTSRGRAAALQRAMSSLIMTGDPRHAHPAAWAPFILVGDGR